MPKRKMPEPDPEAFERMARELGCDETGEAFERALKVLLPPQRASRSAGKQPSSEKIKGGRDGGGRAN